MSRYIGQRLLAAIPVLFGILFVTFALARLLPGDPCKAALGEKANPQTCNAFNARYGLDKPIPTQFAIYLRDVARGDLGTSFRFGRPVSTLLTERLPVTIELTVSALIFATIAGIFLGLVSAVRRNSAVDVGTMFIANIGISMPVFWLGLMLAYVFAILLKGTPFWLPPSGRMTAGTPDDPFYQVWGLALPGGAGGSILQFLSRLNLLNAILSANWKLFKDSLVHLILPALALSTIPTALIARAGLHPDGACQRLEAADRDPQARFPQFAAADRHRPWPFAGQPAGRSGPDGDYLWPVWSGPCALRCHHRPGLRHCAGLYGCDRHFLRRP
jgi:ABC-type dipeptide/oligopeptide/nickel transport system permease component